MNELCITGTTSTMELNQPMGRPKLVPACLNSSEDTMSDMRQSHLRLSLSPLYLFVIRYAK